MTKKIFIVILVTFCLWGVSGSLVFAATTADPSSDGFVTCGKGDGTSGAPAALDCNFAALFAMINKIISWLIMISLPLAAIAFAYAGWLYLTAGEKTDNITKAKHVFISVGIGVGLVLASWLVFKLIADNFLNTSYGTYLNQ